MKLTSCESQKNVVRTKATPPWEMELMVTVCSWYRPAWRMAPDSWLLEAVVFRVSAHLCLLAMLQACPAHQDRTVSDQSFDMLTGHRADRHAWQHDAHES